MKIDLNERATLEERLYPLIHDDIIKAIAIHGIKEISFFAVYEAGIISYSIKHIKMEMAELNISDTSGKFMHEMSNTLMPKLTEMISNERYFMFIDLQAEPNQTFIINIQPMDVAYTKSVNPDDVWNAHCIMTKKDWLAGVIFAAYTPDDGVGYWARDNMYSEINAFEVSPPDATHVVWFGK